MNVNIYGIVIGQTFYCLAGSFVSVASVMLKNNLKEQNKLDEFVKWIESFICNLE